MSIPPPSPTMNFLVLTVQTLFLAFLVTSAVARTPTKLSLGSRQNDERRDTFLVSFNRPAALNDKWFLTGRGGSDEEEEDDDEAEEDDDEEEEENEASEAKMDDMDDLEAEAIPVDLSKVLETAADYTHSTVLPVTKKALVVLFKLGTKATLATMHAVQRAVQAAMEGEDADVDPDADEDDIIVAEVSVVQRAVMAIKRMVTAALTFPEGDEEDMINTEEVLMKAKTQKREKTKLLDFGSFLAAAYGVQDTRTNKTSGVTVIGGSFATAMKEARAQARLLVVFIPVERFKKGKESREAAAIRSILSPEVADASNHPARKGENTGSFLFWSAKVGSSEATQAMKRLKAKLKTSKGGKCPVLMVVYPAMVSEQRLSNEDISILALPSQTISPCARSLTGARARRKWFPRLSHNITAAPHLPRKVWRFG
jgi:hypothetical protein